MIWPEEELNCGMSASSRALFEVAFAVLFGLYLVNVGIKRLVEYTEEAAKAEYIDDQTYKRPQIAGTYAYIYSKMHRKGIRWLRDYREDAGVGLFVGDLFVGGSQVRFFFYIGWKILTFNDIKDTTAGLRQLMSVIRRE